jgi:sulfur carrier protein ThiS
MSPSSWAADGLLGGNVVNECPSIMRRNARKHFLKCVDCGCQTLPQNASRWRSWIAAASLYVIGCVNDGGLCFDCANKRREKLGLAIEFGDIVGPAPQCETKLRKVSINTREYAWEISTLESLLIKWREEGRLSGIKHREITLWLVAVNDQIIPARCFSSMPISDGDKIFIVMGAIAGG